MARRTRTILAAAALLAATLAAYAGVGSLGFVFDDRQYLLRNPQVRGGISWTGLRWAFTTFHESNWHPLAWASHMLDASLFGLRPAGHHAVNLAFHAASTVLLFGLWRGMTGGLWRPALVAGVFALHPLHVESVAWVAERKDVLSAFLGLLALAAYVRHAREPGRRSGIWPAAALCAAGLLAKPMLVTLPLVMLLLDAWPLGRLRLAPPRPGRAGGGIPPLRLLGEKLPLFALAAASSWVTLRAQASSRALIPVGDLPLGARVANAWVSYAAYLRKSLWPADLAVLYPHPGAGIPLDAAFGGATLCAAITVVAWRARRAHPAAAVGWLWFFGMLVPVIGLVQVGNQAMADRYTYLPLVGLAVALAWAAGEAARGGGARRAAVAAGLAAALASLAAMTHVQMSHWKDEVTLYTHTLRVAGGSAAIHSNLGVALAERGDTAGAERQYREAHRAQPQFADALNNIGAALEEQGRPEEAETYYRRALEIRPDHADALVNLGLNLVHRGRGEEGLEAAARAWRSSPDPLPLRRRLAAALTASGRHDLAEREYAEILRLAPEDAQAALDRGLALARLGRLPEAERDFRTALALRPDSAPALVNLANALAAQGQYEEAARRYQEAVARTPEDPDVFFNLGVMLSLMRRDQEAAQAYRKALRLRPDYEEARRNLARLEQGTGGR